MPASMLKIFNSNDCLNIHILIFDYNITLFLSSFDLAGADDTSRIMQYIAGFFSDISASFFSKYFHYLDVDTTISYTFIVSHGHNSFQAYHISTLRLMSAAIMS